MAKPYNHAAEELKFKKKKDAENETCRNNGMKEEAIHEKDKCETLCYVADMTKRSGYPHS